MTILKTIIRPYSPNPPKKTLSNIFPKITLVNHALVFHILTIA